MDLPTLIEPLNPTLLPAGFSFREISMDMRLYTTFQPDCMTIYVIYLEYSQTNLKINT